MFREVSDEDSIATDSTAESEDRDDYSVEKILSERIEDDGSCRYLIKWKGYALHRASWEPAENLGAGILQNWERTKARIAERKEEPFDVTKFQEAADDEKEAKQNRHKRRKAKRRRRAVEVSPSPETSDDKRRADSATSIQRRTRDTEQSPPPRKRIRVRQPEVKRRGVAQKIVRTKPRSVPLSDGSGSDESDSDDSEDSLFNELRRSAERRRAKRPATAQTTAMDTRSKRLVPTRTTSTAARPATSSGSASSTSATSRCTHKGTAKASAAAIPSDKPEEALEQRNGASQRAAESRTKNLQSSKPTVSSAAKKSVPNTETNTMSISNSNRKAANVNIFENWSENKTPRQRLRVSGETPKDSHDPKFVNLAQQNRFQKYSRNEKVPDVSSLTLVDPKTGKIVPSTKSAQATVSSASPSVANQNPWAEERRSNAANARSSEAVVNIPKHQVTAPATPPNAGVLAGLEKGNLKTQTCQNWQAGSCQYTAQTCAFAHSRITCFFWKHGGCNKGDNACPLAHFDTGIVAASPSGYSGRFADAAASTTPLTGDSSMVARRVPNKDKECFFWHQGNCYRSEETCDFAHHRTGIVAEPPGGYNVNKQKTCFFWSRGDCKKSSDVCPHAHYDTGVVAAPPPGYGFRDADAASNTASSSGDNMIKMPHTSPKLSSLGSIPTRPAAKRVEVCSDWSRGGEGPRGCRNTSQTCQYLHRQIIKKDKECFFWKTRGNCMRSEETCEFAHHNTGIAADPPAGFRGLDTDITFKSASPIVAPKDTTCWWYMQPSGCNKPEVLCQFAHRDTGVYAPGPGSYKYGARPTVRPPQSPIPASASSALPSPSPPPPPPSDPPPPPDHDSRQSEASVNTAFIRPITARLATSATLLLDCAGGHETTLLKVKLEIADNNTLRSLTAQVPVLRIRSMITTHDFQHLLHADISRVQNFVGGMIVDPAFAKEADAFTELMNQHDSGVVADVQGHDLQFVIWPGRAERWKFLEDTGVVLSNQSALHFRTFEKMLATIKLTEQLALFQPTVAQRHYMVRLGESFAGIDLERLLHMPEITKSISAVFMMYLQTHEIEVPLLSECFQGAGLKVYHSGTPGAWEYFRTNHSKAGLVVLHPEVPWWQVPGLHELLAQTSVKFFKIHSNKIPTSFEAEKECDNAERLFPHGNVALITDDVFVYHPQQAIDVIQAFLDAHQHKPEGAENNRIVTRPGVKAWLRGLMEQNVAERGRQDDRWPRLYDAICRLCPPEDEESGDDESPLPTSNLVSISPDLLPSFEGLWEESKRAATDFMVEWFAGWAILNADKYRRFVICHEPKDPVTKSVTDTDGKTVAQVEVDPRGWAKKATYQHLGVAPPEKVAVMLTPPPKKKK